MSDGVQMDSDDVGSLPIKKTLAADLTAGLVVSLVALPLCLGIALASQAEGVAEASNATLFSGILAGIVGGLIVGVISGSHTSVSGPAAGLTAVVAAQIAGLGSFQAFLMADVIAGVNHLALGVIRAGSIADFVPSSVIKGLLAAIGIILILKQIPHLFGHDADVEGDMSFQQMDSENTFSELFEIVANLHPSAALIGILSLALLVVWGNAKWLKQSVVPGPLVVVLFGVAVKLLMDRFGGPWSIEEDHLVQVPVADSFTGFLGFLKTPEFHALTNPKVYTAAITIAIVASLETLLNVEAVDKLDPQKRVSPANRELIAQGVGNMTAGLIGGLPVTSVIVRGSVNVGTGAKTKLSAIVHGALLLLFVALLPGWLNQIPLSSLAAVLIVAGFKLAKPNLFRQMWREGMNQFLPFAVTVSAIVFTDLLVGILIGLGFSILFILRSNLRRPLNRIVEQHVSGEVTRVELANQVSFLNRVALSKALESVPHGGHLLIDARRTDYIDADVLDLIWDYMEETAPVRDVKVSTLGLRDHYEPLQDRLQYVDYTTREMQASLTPDKVLQLLKEGNARFREGRQLTRDLARRLEATADLQHPLAVILSGASSRTPVEAIFDVSVGDVFCVRVSGNLISEGVLGSLEYASVFAQAKLIVVMGHRNSKLMRLSIESYLDEGRPTECVECGNLDPIVAEVQRSIDPDRLRGWEEMDAEVQQTQVDDLYRAHLLRTIDKLPARSQALRRLIDEGNVGIVGCMYDVRSGQVEFFS